MNCAGYTSLPTFTINSVPKCLRIMIARPAKQFRSWCWGRYCNRTASSGISSNSLDLLLPGLACNSALLRRVSKAGAVPASRSIDVGWTGSLLLLFRGVLGAEEINWGTRRASPLIGNGSSTSELLFSSSCFLLLERSGGLVKFHKPCFFKLCLWNRTDSSVTKSQKAASM